jgi:L-threonylcarbamoyladenylate synthase
LLERGELVAFPTDTVYGVGALVHDAPAVENIYTVKERPNEKAIPVLLGSVDDLSKVAVNVSEAAIKLAKHFWPGALTIIVAKQSNIPEAVSATETIGVRVPAYAPVLDLFQRTGPLAVTSANISGQPSPATADEVLAQLGGRIPLILDGGRTRGGVASTVVDMNSAEPKILRPGPITLEQILAELG